MHSSPLVPVFHSFIIFIEVAMICRLRIVERYVGQINEIPKRFISTVGSEPQPKRVIIIPTYTSTKTDKKQRGQASGPKEASEQIRVLGGGTEQKHNTVKISNSDFKFIQNNSMSRHMP